MIKSTSKIPGIRLSCTDNGVLLVGF